MTKDIGDTHLTDIELNHHIQRQILNSFQHKDICTYSELLVDGMSGNSFIYHLKALIRQKLIVKTGIHSYELSTLGRLVLDNISFETSRFRLRPTTGVLVLAKTPDDQYMLYRSKRQPLIGKSGLVFGKSRVGQNFTEMLDRITSRRGIKEYSLLSTSAINVIYREKGQIISHRVGLFVLIETSGVTEDRETDAGISYWSSALDLPDLLPEVAVVLNRKNDSFIEIDFDISLN